MRERTIGSEFTMRKSDGKKVYHDKKRDGQRVDRKKDQRGEISPSERAMG